MSNYDVTKNINKNKSIIVKILNNNLEILFVRFAYLSFKNTITTLIADISFNISIILTIKIQLLQSEYKYYYQIKRLH